MRGKLGGQQGDGDELGAAAAAVDRGGNEGGSKKGNVSAGRERASARRDVVRSGSVWPGGSGRRRHVVSTRRSQSATVGH